MKEIKTQKDFIISLLFCIPSILLLIYLSLYAPTVLYLIFIYLFIISFPFFLYHISKIIISYLKDKRRKQK